MRKRIKRQSSTSSPIVPLQQSIPNIQSPSQDELTKLNETFSNPDKGADLAKAVSARVEMLKSIKLGWKTYSQEDDADHSSEEEQAFNDNADSDSGNDEDLIEVELLTADYYDSRRNLYKEPAPRYKRIGNTYVLQNFGGHEDLKDNNSF